MPLDMLVSGRIATFAGDAGFGWVEAIGIRDGMVAFAGTAVDLETRADPHTRRVELEPGEIGIPGLTDAHIHLTDTALAADNADLSRTATLEDGLARIAEGARRVPAPAWIEGAGWDHRRWGAYPTADAIERAAPGRLVALRSFDHHAVLASRAALAAAGIGADTADPPGGIISRTADGSPDGVLFENASELVVRLIPPPDDDTIRRAVTAVGRELLALGVVGAHEPGSLGTDADNHLLDLYGELAAAGDLPIRLRAGVQSDGLENAIERGWRSGGPIGGADPARLSVGWLKLFADGTLGSRTAALLVPLEGSTSRGIFTTPPEELASVAKRAAGAGIATQVHAIGDAAVREALVALAPTVGLVPLMPRLEHVQLCHPDDRPMFAEHGVAASVQPIHLREDAATARRDWGARAESAGYTWRSLFDAGAVVAFGTDAPVVPIDPWPGIALSVLRRDPSWPEGVEAFGPHEAITVEEALRAATVGPAQTAKDSLGGRLVPGSRADLVVLPAAPDAAPRSAESFAQVRPRLVMVGGDVEIER